MREGGQWQRLVIAMLASGACSERGPAAAQEGVDVTDGDTSTAPACGSLRRTESGGCCPGGTFYDFDADTCRPVGPPECAEVLPESPDKCVPRWCWDWRMADGGPCPTGERWCLPFGRICTGAEIAAAQGCPAGMTPRARDDSTCVPAGLLDQPTHAWESPSGAFVPAAIVAPTGVPPLRPVPAVGQLAFCRDVEDGGARFCGENAQGAAEESPCGPGQTPAVGEQGCVELGVQWTCPPGFVTDAADKAKLPGCKPDPSVCPTGDWPLSPATGKTVYVKAGAAGGDGSSAAPLPTIVAGVKAAGVGGTVLVGPGVFAENIVVEHAVTLIGACAAKVTVGTQTTEPTLHIQGGATGEVVVRGLTLTGTAMAARVEGALNARLQALHVRDNVDIGVYVRDGKLTLVDSVVSGTRLGPLTHGYGVGAGSGGSAVLQRVRVHDNETGGIYAFKPGSKMVARDVLVTATQASSKEERARGVWVVGGATMELESVRVSANRYRGVEASGVGTSLRAVGLLVDDTQPDAKLARLGVGLSVAGGAKAELTGCRFSANSFTALEVFGAGTSVAVRGLLIDDVRLSYPWDYAPATPSSGAVGDYRIGAGVWVSGGARADITDMRVHGAHRIGATANDPNSTLDARRVLVDGVIGATIVPGRFAGADNKHWIDGLFGGGIYAAFGGHADLDTCRISGSDATAVRVLHPGSRIRARGLLIDNSGDDAGDRFGDALQVRCGGQAQLWASRLNGSSRYGALVAGDYLPQGADSFCRSGPPSELVVAGSLVDDTRPAADGLHGMAIQAGLQARATLVGSRVVAGHTSLVVCNQNPGQHFSVVGTDLSHGKPAPAENYGGIAIRLHRCTATLTSVLMRHNGYAALASYGSSLVADGLVAIATQGGTLVDVKPEDTVLREMADGITVVDADKAQLVRSVLVANKRAGATYKAGSGLALTSSLVTGSEFGVFALGDTKVERTGNLLHGNGTNVASGDALQVPDIPTALSLTP